MTTPDSPEAAFADAGRAMSTGDWDGFFAVIATKDLRRLASMGVAGMLNSDSGRELLAEHGVGTAVIRVAVDAANRVIESAASGWRDLPADEQVTWSIRHRDLVAAHAAATDAAARSARDLPALVAAIERHRRVTEGGGSVSSRLFVDETLVDVDVGDGGKRARGLRRYANGTTDPVAFVRERAGWRVSIFGR